MYVHMYVCMYVYIYKSTFLSKVSFKEGISQE